MTSNGGTVSACTDLATDPHNCGACGADCAGSACVAGTCSCATGFSLCGGSCIDTTSDPDNCGGCGIPCGPGGVCSGGTCSTCGTGYTLCGVYCIDTEHDRYNCGACLHLCEVGQSCLAGHCTCAPPMMDCGAGCTDLSTDVDNCGTCGTSCGPGGTCTSGTCTCATGYTDCSGACINTATDRDHCGTCGNSCPAGNVCIMGACSDAPPTQYMQTTATAADAPFVDACAAAGAIRSCRAPDDGYTSITLPFPFRYWRSISPMESMINVNSNGSIGMDGTAYSSLSGSIPSTTAPNAVIAPHWGDLYQTTGICVAMVGAAPNRQLVIEWADSVYFSSRTADDTFEIVLSESSGIIDLIYQSMVGALSETMGIEDQTGATGINACPGGTSTCTPTTRERDRFRRSRRRPNRLVPRPVRRLPRVCVGPTASAPAPRELHAPQALVDHAPGVEAAAAERPEHPRAFAALDLDARQGEGVGARGDGAVLGGEDGRVAGVAQHAGGPVAVVGARPERIGEGGDRPAEARLEGLLRSVRLFLCLLDGHLSERAVVKGVGADGDAAFGEAAELVPGEVVLVLLTVGAAPRSQAAGDDERDRRYAMGLEDRLGRGQGAPAAVVDRDQHRSVCDGPLAPHEGLEVGQGDGEAGPREPGHLGVEDARVHAEGIAPRAAEAMVGQDAHVGYRAVRRCTSRRRRGHGGDRVARHLLGPEPPPSKRAVLHGSHLRPRTTRKRKRGLPSR